MTLSRDGLHTTAQPSRASSPAASEANALDLVIIGFPHKTKLCHYYLFLTILITDLPKPPSLTAHFPALVRGPRYVTLYGEKRVTADRLRRQRDTSLVADDDQDRYRKHAYL